MKIGNKFDVIILGAGISGLLLGSQLSKKHSILVVEKSDRIPQNKYWLTKRDCLTNNGELEQNVEIHYNHMDFIAYDRTTFRCNGEYILWNTNRLVTSLENVIKQNNGKLLYGYKFYSYRVADKQIHIAANDLEFSAKLVIDCMGYASPIIYAKQIIDIIGYYVLYGNVLELKKEISPIGLCNLMVESKPKYLEVFPTSDRLAYTVLITPEKSAKIGGDIQKEFNFVVRESYYSKYFCKNSPKGSLWGVVPTGKLRKRALDRIFFYGEAGQINPAATATSLTRLLYSYKEIADFLSDKIEKDELAMSKLGENKDFWDSFNRKFHLNLFQDILRWNSDQFRDLIIQMSYMEQNIVNDIIFGELDYKDFLKPRGFMPLLTNRNPVVLKALLKSLITRKET